MGNMEGYVARQAIYDRSLAVVAYELLYRGSPGATTANESDARASEDALTNGFFAVGWKALVGDYPALWNVPQDLLMSDRILVLPPDRVYLEILETVEPTSEVLKRCEELRSLGYRLVLDDYMGEADRQPILELCYLVKVDWMGCSTETKRAIPNQGRIRCLAEKVETQLECNEALRWGYNYLQGYFLERPQLLSGRKIPAAHMDRLRLLAELAKQEPDLKVIESAVKRDLDLTYKVLTWVNSAAAGRGVRASSVMEALLWMGIDRFRRFISVFAMAGLGGGFHEQLLQTALVRARMSELIAQTAEGGRENSKAFLGGLLSMLEPLLAKPISEICEEMALPEEIRELLVPSSCLHGGTAKRSLDIAAAWEKGEADAAKACAELPSLTASGLSSIYMESVRWARDGFDRQDFRRPL